MPPPPEFLIVENNRDSRYLLTKTLLRKYPSAHVEECDESETAVRAVKRPGLRAAIVHRAWDVDGLAIIRALRQENLTLPILAVSGIDRREAAFEAGATAFLQYDAWLRVGTVVEEMLRTGNTQTPFQNLNADGTAPRPAEDDPVGEKL